MAGPDKSANDAKGEGPPWKIINFTIMLMMGLALSQILPLHLEHHTYEKIEMISECLTMFCLSFLMVHVGYELDLDKSKWRDYGFDYFVAMGAAGIPWILVSAWFRLAMPVSVSWSAALLLGRFAAPTSAGILFTMLEAAGLKETWLYQKARLLAILDDLDTILLMIPLKVMMVGFKWQLLGDAAIVIGLLGLAWTHLHQVKLPSTWNWTMLYAAAVTAVCMLLSKMTNGQIQLEVLLPAFTIGCVTKIPHHQSSSSTSGNDVNAVSANFARDVSEGNEEAEKMEESIQTGVSTIFMFLVGLSMPSLFTGQDAGAVSGSVIAFHVVAVTFLMIVGKLVVSLCYSDEAGINSRLGLGFGMCPRGEVGAGVIVISLSLGIKGVTVTVAVICLAVNLILSSGFIFAVKELLRAEMSSTKAPPRVGKPRRTWLILAIVVLGAAAAGKFVLQTRDPIPTFASPNLCVKHARSSFSAVREPKPGIVTVLGR